MNINTHTFVDSRQASGWHKAWWNLGLALMALNLAACSALDVLGGSKMSDLQLTVDVLNVSLKDAQRAMTELHAQVEVRNRELAETQVIRAQLEGRVQEAEHRLGEARHVISLQREELAESRIDRERIARTGTLLKGQLKQLRKQLSRIERQAAGGVSPASMDLSAEKPLRQVSIGMTETVSVDEAQEEHRGLPQVDEAMSGSTAVAQAAIPAMPSRVMIKHGDTLWSLAQRYRTTVQQLMTVNALSSDYIQAGQGLWVSETAIDGSYDVRR
ncbi:MAG: hypothetical protein A4C66_01945 [Nitrospira sp. HN-bin3]|nr:MAG: hypothetical protein A4C66_01945 [Nitrospira sp. HN-bin3]